MRTGAVLHQSSSKHVHFLKQLRRAPLLCGGWQVVSEVQARSGVSHRQEITNVLWALAALDQLQAQHFASLAAMLDEETVLENMSQSGARQLSQVAASPHAACNLHAGAGCAVPFACLASNTLVSLCFAHSVTSLRC